MAIRYILVLIVGIIVGFLGGLFGKGGSAIATPLLSLIGLPGFIAVAAPLPATVPGTFIASVEYWKANFIDWQIVRWSILFGLPATVLGSYLTYFTGPAPLLIVTGLLVLAFGVSFLVSRGETTSSPSASEPPLPRGQRSRVLPLALVAIFVGLVSGLLANSGGFLLAPSYARILHLPIKRAFACSLAVSMFLALPGTVAHALLGHIDWTVTLVLALGSVPCSYLGARVAIRSHPRNLERWYGVALTLLGAYFLFQL